MFESLRSNALAEFSEITVFCDGPKQNATAEEITRIEEVRSIANSQTWCMQLRVISSEKNRGLADSVITGVSAVLEKHGRVIVIEDDVILSPVFLTFMNESLRVYENEPRVLSIGSWNYFHHPPSSGNHFFLTMPDTIAWATWSRAWKLFQADSLSLIEQLNEKNLMRRLNLNGQYNFEKMLRAQADGKVSSWAIRWTAVAVLNDTLSLYPARALSKHAGFGGEATNYFGFDFNSQLELAPEKLPVEFIRPEYCEEAEKGWIRIERDIIGSDAVLRYPFFSARTWRNLKRKLKSMLSGR
jgi:hypothetical protein